MMRTNAVKNSPTAFQFHRGLTKNRHNCIPYLYYILSIPSRINYNYVLTITEGGFTFFQFHRGLTNFLGLPLLPLFSFFQFHRGLTDFEEMVEEGKLSKTFQFHRGLTN